MLFLYKCLGKVLSSDGEGVETRKTRYEVNIFIQIHRFVKAQDFSFPMAIVY